MVLWVFDQWENVADTEQVRYGKGERCGLVSVEEENTPLMLLKLYAGENRGVTIWKYTVAF